MAISYYLTGQKCMRVFFFFLGYIKCQGMDTKLLTRGKGTPSQPWQHLDVFLYANFLLLLSKKKGAENWVNYLFVSAQNLISSFWRLSTTFHSDAVIMALPVWVLFLAQFWQHWIVTACIVISSMGVFPWVHFLLLTPMWGYIPDY